MTSDIFGGRGTAYGVAIATGVRAVTYIYQSGVTLGDAFYRRGRLSRKEGFAVPRTRTVNLRWKSLFDELRWSGLTQAAFCCRRCDGR